MYLITRQLVSITCITGAIFAAANACAEDADSSREAAEILDKVFAARMKANHGTWQLTRTTTVDGLPNKATLHVQWHADFSRFCEWSDAGKLRRCGIRTDTKILSSTPISGRIANLNAGYGYTLFDPRLLGFDSIQSPRNLASSLQTHIPQEVTIHQPTDYVHGIECVVIEWKRNRGRQHFWIAKSDHQTVLKVQDFNNQIVVESTYAPGAQLPTRVRFTRTPRDPRASPVITEFVVESAEMEDVPLETFSLSGLGLNIGDAVTEGSAGGITGFWNGNGLSDSIEKAEAAATLP